jgi:hypothetical protein
MPVCVVIFDPAIEIPDGLLSHLCLDKSGYGEKEPK